jgi:hypothetical protein
MARMVKTYAKKICVMEEKIYTKTNSVLILFCKINATDFGTLQFI